MDYYFFNNQGGFSTHDYARLNVSFSVGDDEHCVKQNRLLIKKQIKAPVLVSARQVHKDDIYLVGPGLSEDLEVDGYDALITDCPGIALMVQLADCQGLLFHDPSKAVIAAVHCGWRGNVIGIIGKTIQKMVDSFGSEPSEVMAFISPSLGPCCAEFINYRTELPKSFHRFQVKPGYFNLWEISLSQLIASGLDKQNIVVSGICTSCRNDFFSYRRACRKGSGITGRHCAVISL